jgi:polyisoprenoid-binding protein YceI
MFKAVRLFGVGLLSALVMVGTGVAETYEIDKGHSSVDFSIRHLVGRTSGHFNTFSGTVMYDPAHPEKTSVEATIDVASIDTGHEGRDGHLRKDDFFGVETYPTMTFKSTSAKVDGETILLTGDFTMHGTTKAITLPVVVLGVGVHPRNKAPLAGFETGLVLKRSDYGVNSWTDVAGVLGDEVKVHIALETKGPKPEKMEKMEK